MTAMLELFARTGFRKWLLTLSRFKKKAIALLAKRVVPTVDRGVYIALGKWSNQINLAGYMHVPLKRFALELAGRATLFKVDEFRTSKLCSECFSPMSDMPFLVAGSTTPSLRGTCADVKT
jgi:hypothetical protein